MPSDSSCSRRWYVTDTRYGGRRGETAGGISDRPFAVLRTWTDPRMVDASIEPTERQPNLCNAGLPVKANRLAYGIAAACTLRNWLSMWSLRVSQTRAEPHLARVTCPALVINA